jgi:hypothetical protein
MKDGDSTTQETSEDLKPGTPGYRKRCSPKEVHFAKLMADTGMGGVEAARIAFGWRCEPGSKENQKARTLAITPRIKEKMEEFKARRSQEQAAKMAVKMDFGDLQKGDLREYAFKLLAKLRDNPTTKASTRFNAIKILKKLHDPGKDINLIWKWIDVAWRYQTMHCPACHKNYPLANLHNAKLKEWRDRNEVKYTNTPLPQKIDRQMQIIKLADKRRTPHKSQIEVLTAPERHIVGQGAARAGKSYLLALYAVMGFCLPGVEIWILGETYDRTSKEVDYIKRFLRSIFYPHDAAMINMQHDKKSGELIITSKWGSEIRVKSSKARGSITGHALEYALCAEPGWLPADIYEELRARMSERLGRIIALGTPKGVGGFISRLTHAVGRDPETGKVRRWLPEERLVENGCSWEASVRVIQISPEDNPEYVKSELATARMELTDEEYAAEFEGIGISAEGLKFGRVKREHLREVEDYFFSSAGFILGIDQGPKNFAACLIAWDGHKIVPCWEYYNSDEHTTMKKNLLRLYERVPIWIEDLGGDPDRWILTITDKDPQLIQTFSEIEEEGRVWPTDITERHKNLARLTENWRRANQEFVNNMARAGRMEFHLRHDQYTEVDEAPGAELLHDQVLQTIDVPEDPDRESKSNLLKGWQVHNPMRGDHVLDAWYFAVWTINSQQAQLPEGISIPSDNRDPWARQKAAFEKSFKRSEDRELGRSRHQVGEDISSAEAWRRVLNNGSGTSMFNKNTHWGDE